MCSETKGLDEVSQKEEPNTESELVKMQAKIDAKEKAIANLCNYCCFINGKLHTAEKSLSQREMDLQISSAAFKKLECQLRSQNEVIAEKEAHMRKLESSKAVENSELRSRIQFLQSYVHEAKSMLQRTEQGTIAEGSQDHTSGALVSEELVECKAKIKSMEKETSDFKQQNRDLHEKIKIYERDMSASERTVERLTLDLEKLKIESSSRSENQDMDEKEAAEAKMKARSETGYLIVELRKAEADLSKANENARTWRTKAEELQPLAESTLEAQRAVEIVSSQLALLQKESKQGIDLLQLQLKEAERERDVAERDCATAITDYTSMRTRLTEVHNRGSAYSRLAVANTLCAVTFVLEGPTAPGADIMVYVLGEDGALGQWNSSRKLPVRVVEDGDHGVVRRCEVVLPANISTYYKYAADAPDGSLIWEGEENRSLQLHGDSTILVTDTWRPSQ